MWQDIVMLVELYVYISSNIHRTHATRIQCGVITSVKQVIKEKLIFYQNN